MRIIMPAVRILSVLSIISIPVGAHAAEYGFSTYGLGGNAFGAGATPPPGLSYTTLINQTPLVLSLRHYREFNVENRWEGNMTIATGTVRF